jgi:hypothetical protein
MHRAPGDAMFEHVRNWFAIGESGKRPAVTGWVRLRRLALFIGLTRLVLHLLTGGMF